MKSIIFLSLITTVLSHPFWTGSSYTGYKPKISKLQLRDNGKIGPYYPQMRPSPDIDNLYKEFQTQSKRISDQIGNQNEKPNAPGPEAIPINEDNSQENLENNYAPQDQYNPENVEFETENAENGESPNQDPNTNYPDNPGQEYGTQQQEYGVPPLQDEQFSEPKSLPKIGSVPNQLYPPNNDPYDLPSPDFDSKEFSKENGYELWEQQLPRGEPPKDWQRVDSSLSWYRPTEYPKTKYVWGRESQEHYQKDRIDEEGQRLLEQIRQYRIKSSIRDGKVLPADFDTTDYKKRFNIRHHGKGVRSSYVPQSRPQYTYGPPRKAYGRPQFTTPRPEETTYGTTKPPIEITTQKNKQDSSTNINRIPTSDSQDSESGSNIAISTAVARQGQYYVLQPNGRLQKVTYQTASDPRKTGRPVISNLKYEYVNPIKDPIYAYQNGQLVRIN